MSKPSEIKTKRISLKKFMNILESQNFGTEIIGVEESEEIEFKSIPYKKNDSKDDFELVKDITGLANANGGVICIGVNNGKSFEGRNVSYAKSLAANNNDIKTEIWLKLLKNNVTPAFPTNLIEFKSYGKNNDLFCIYVKKAPASIFPFLVISKSSKSTDGKIIKGYLFNCYRRDGDDTLPWISPALLQRYISKGLKDDGKKGSDLETILPMIEAISNQLSDIESKVEQAKINNNSVGEDQSLLTDYVESRLEYETGYFFIEAVPKSEIIVDNFWDEGENTVSNLIKNPPILRRMGWDQEVAISEHPYANGANWEIMNGNRKILIATKSGKLFAGGAFENFLDGGADEDVYPPENIQGKKINNLALVEYIDTFCHLLAAFKNLIGAKSDYLVSVGFKTSVGVKVFLVRPFLLGSFINRFVGPMNNEINTIIVKDDGKDSKHLAGGIIKELYASLFSDTSDNAYLIKDNDGWAVNEEFIKSI